MIPVVVTTVVVMAVDVDSANPEPGLTARVLVARRAVAMHRALPNEDGEVSHESFALRSFRGARPEGYCAAALLGPRGEGQLWKASLR